MNLCKFMQAQGKSVKGNWSSSCWGGGENSKFKILNKCSSDEKYPNTLLTSAVKSILKLRKVKSKCKTKINSDLDAKSEHFNFKNLDISAESDLD